MNIHMRDVKGFLELANAERLTDYNTKRRACNGDVRSSDELCPVKPNGELRDLLLILHISVSLQVAIGGGMMIYYGDEAGNYVAGIAIAVFTVCLIKLFRGQR